ncbi:MAG: histidinol-phosphate transaminase [Anaerolineaceae bacterium]|nr:histidinol-phosphate transaminase [Anaerolineaceae bacterium]
MFSSNHYSEQHGGLSPRELRRYGINPADLIDFSVNSNPFGPSPSVLNKINSVDISKYPDPEAFLAREALASACKTDADHLLLGNGTSELIWLCAQALIHPGEPALILGPTFSEYRRALEAMGAEPEEIRANPPNFEIPILKILHKVRSMRPKLLFLCNPNNPTGALLDKESLRQISETCGSDTILIVDEAYSAFVDGQCFSSLPTANSLILRSMTKDFALAGLRLGYALGSKDLIQRLKDKQPTWSVNAVAQAAALAVLEDLPYYQTCFEQLHQLKSRFFSGMRTIGIAINDSATHYGVFQTNAAAKLIRGALLRMGIQVRDCASFGLPHNIRISTQLESSNRLLLDALINLIKGKTI